MAVLESSECCPVAVSGLLRLGNQATASLTMVPRRAKTNVFPMVFAGVSEMSDALPRHASRNHFGAIIRQSIGDLGAVLGPFWRHLDAI